jgi:septum site-determining protein MinD|tara:strand:+ start:18541 stop:19344 length:804 start_codon:yes stop_codon:yes gene_type:complete
MAKIIVITSGKGGVGKTTTTANLGVALANLGYSTVLIDADVGLRNLDLLLGLENRIIYTASDVLLGECSLEQALIKDKRQSKLYLLPASQNRTKDVLTSHDMNQLVNLLKDKHDYILIDSPAGIETGFFSAIKPAREAIIVTTPEITAVRDADRVIGLLEASGFEKISLLLNRLRPKMVKANNMMSIDDVKEILSIPLLGVIPEDEIVIVSTNRGEPLVLNQDFSLAKLAFENTSRRLVGETVAFLDFDRTYRLHFNRIKNFFSTIK